MSAVKTRGLCRTEQTETRWRFSGWATQDAHENTIRPRGYTRSCVSCSTQVLTLGDVDDADGLCRSVLGEWLRRAGGASDKIDTDNVLGDLRALVWHLYKRWDPRALTFTSFATGIMRKKINTFVSIDVGDPTDNRGRSPKAHSRSTTASYDGLTGWQPLHNGTHAKNVEEGHSFSDRCGLDFAYGVESLDPTGDRVAASSWLDNG